MKAKTQTAPKTKFVLIDAQLQQNNFEVANAYSMITTSAIELLQRFELTKYRTWINFEHCKNT